MRFVFLCACLVLSGCSSFGRGVTEAILDSQSRDTEDTRACDIIGEPFEGIATAVERQSNVAITEPSRPTTKVVYVHGIGDHQPGHGGKLLNSLMMALDLEVIAERAKRLELQAPDGVPRDYGEVNVVRLSDANRTRELLFFEHTWNPITREEKEAIAFDNAVIYSRQRASLNNAVRTFANAVLPDPLAFVGNRGKDIRGSVGEVICWAMSATWSDLDDRKDPGRCEDSPLYGARVTEDAYAIVTHSLGSRATVDALQAAARANDALTESSPAARAFADALSKKQLSLFMLSNQLPLLEAGQDSQQVVGQSDVYCAENAPRSAERFLRQLDMVAFTDPNDILSFPVPAAWAEDYLDSRLCARVRNVTINIAHVRRLPAIGEFADPLSAHTRYDEDERVVNLMAFGIGQPYTAEVVSERCDWVKVDPALN
jgi:hypothetical protein